MDRRLNLEKLNSDDPKIKYAFAKELFHLSEENPQEVYANFNDWVGLLDDSNNIIKWTAIDIIGNLSNADTENKINDEVIKKLFDLLHDTKVITCNHAISALSIIARNKPVYKEQIINEFFSVPDNDFESDECEAIATGKIIDAINPFLPELGTDKKVIDFVKIAATSQRNSTRKKAEEFLKKLGK